MFKLCIVFQDRPIPEGLKRLFLSGKNESEIRKEIEGNSTLLQELMTPSTYFFYTLFSIPRNRNISSAISVIMIITLAVVMTSLGKLSYATFKGFYFMHKNSI